MTDKKYSPPDMLGYDTSNEQAKLVPLLNLGLPKLFQRNEWKTFVAVIQARDISGTYVYAPTDSQIEKVN